MVRETLLAPEMSITFRAEDSDGGEGAWRAGHTMLHVRSHRCVTSSLQTLLLVLNTFRLTMAPVSFAIT